MKMYASEDKGQFFPPVKKYLYDAATGACDIPNGRPLSPPPDFPGPDFFFDAKTVYPEYLSDLNVLVCPSDSQAGAVAAGAWNVDGDPKNPYDLCRVGSLSYTYITWVFAGERDYVRAGHSENEDPPAISMNFIAKLGATLVQAGSGDVRLFDADMQYTHEDYGPITAYRLREGVERFMITDINNPAATALAQSQVGFMCDNFTNKTANFNHVPGGGNVLYMDGHVEFVRYPGRFPFSRAWAYIVELAGL
jgi:prepilin-type processing-associated H-X9-DG protein